MEIMQLEKERIERERIEGVLARLMRGIGEVDLRRMWGGGGNQDADAELKRIQTTSFNLQSDHTRLHVEVWRAQQELKNGELELEGVEERKRYAEAGIRRN
ncbi:hypothetical protein BDY24DRAFT_386418 [Mrakia frigida]|uniref:uncharacterized protein n=1 Tax=Mrakia frigida TaxID=29902 RepID=UPI003FCBFE37